ncbi:hypothetical protein RFI_00563 [Reticulomyxa filosa]|uniref:Uncharacterized protein n=1 Tax=Reticulomyxa filosa TaxID=46433 RepID=X6PE57_RETFI|nr:hypothetical protein RFI_00563 [Reticulomyxa filosa]|eukprot:ETO36496.1 hypothetical protein RFI_00563 [Reticulomyxa filosa]
MLRNYVDAKRKNLETLIFMYVLTILKQTTKKTFSDECISSERKARRMVCSLRELYLLIHLFCIVIGIDLFFNKRHFNIWPKSGKYAKLCIHGILEFPREFPKKPPNVEIVSPITIANIPFKHPLIVDVNHKLMVKLQLLQRV